MTAAGHGPILSPVEGDPRADLQRLVGRWPNRHWLYVEPQPDGRWLIDVAWLPAGLVMPEPSDLLPDGRRRRFYVPPDELRMSRLFAAIARAFLTINGEVP